MIDARKPLLALLRGAVLLAILAVVSGCASRQPSTGQVQPATVTRPDSAVTPRPTSSTFLSTCGSLYTLQVEGQIVPIGQCAGTLSTHSAPRIAVRLGLTLTLTPVGGRWATDVGVPASDAPAVVSLNTAPSPTEPATYVAHRVGMAMLSTVTAFCTDGPVRTAAVGGSPALRECPVADVVVTP
jgi:hypothetical protein